MDENHLRDALNELATAAERRMLPQARAAAVAATLRECAALRACGEPAVRAISCDALRAAYNLLARGRPEDTVAIRARRTTCHELAFMGRVSTTTLNDRALTLASQLWLNMALEIERSYDPRSQAIAATLRRESYELLLALENQSPPFGISA